MSIDMGLKERLRPGSDDHVGQTGAVSMLAAAPVLRGVRVGVIGCGYWGSKHVRVLSGLAGVGGVAVIDPDPRIRGAITSAFPAVRGFPDLASALPHVDAAVVATPPRNHAEVALQALRAGKHVLVEKPITTTLVDARLLAAEARRAGVILMAGHTFEFNPAVRELRRRMDQGELGEIYYIHSARLNLGLYRSDVNVVWDLAPHDISIMNYLLRSTPTVVSAWGSSHACGEVKDLAYVRLQYAACGVVGYAHVSWLDPRKTRRITVVGSRKMAVYDDLADEKLRIFDCGVEGGLPGEGVVPYERPISYRQGDIVSPRIDAEEPLAVEDRHFIECIRDRTTPVSDAASGIAVVAVLEAIDRSLSSGTPYAVDGAGEIAPATIARSA
jgi:predicted dehydrogenase